MLVQKMKIVKLFLIIINNYERNNNLLSNDENKIFIIAECWDNLTSKRLGFSENSEQDILNVTNNYKYTRQEDLIDQEKNLVFLPND